MKALLFRLVSSFAMLGLLLLLERLIGVASIQNTEGCCTAIDLWAVIQRKQTGNASTQDTQDHCEVVAVARA